MRFVNSPNKPTSYLNAMQIIFIGMIWMRFHEKLAEQNNKSIEHKARSKNNQLSESIRFYTFRIGFIIYENFKCARSNRNILLRFKQFAWICT